MVPVVTPEELKPLEKEFGELLARQKGFVWYQLIDSISIMAVIMLFGAYPNWFLDWTVVVIVLPVLLIIFGWANQSETPKRAWKTFV